MASKPQYLLSIDPGLSSGIALFRYSDIDPAILIEKWQITGGIDGFLEWLEPHYMYPDHEYVLGGAEMGFEGCSWREIGGETLAVTVEKFTPRQALTLDAAEPMLIEGALIALGIVPKYTPPKHPNWAQPSAQYFAGGKTLPEKKKRQHKWLKDWGFYVTGKDVGCKDADDVRSAISHGLAWFRRQKHMPTIQQYFGRSDDEA